MADMLVLNQDQAARDKILGIPPGAKYLGGTEHFEKIPVAVLQKLVDEKFADPSDKQNSSPSIGQILEFMTAHPQIMASGYAVDKKRDDYRVSIDTLDWDGKIPMLLDLPFDFARFVNRFHPDEVEIETYSLHAWWD